MFWGKLFPTKEDLVVAICDENLIGKEIQMKDCIVKVSKYFYGGQLIDENLAVKAMERATVGNLMEKRLSYLPRRRASSPRRT